MSCTACMGNVSADKSCYACGLKGPAGQAVLTVHDIEMMRHALGVQQRGGKWTAPYRNHYVAGADAEAAWERMVKHGFARVRTISSELTGGDPCFSVADTGREVALAGLPIPKAKVAQ